MGEHKKEFPSQGVGFQDVLSSIQKRKGKDVKWDSGKMFGFVYHPGDDVARLVEQIYQLYFYENALNPILFPSIRELENEANYYI